MFNFLAALDPALTRAGMEWGNLIFSIDTMSLAAASVIETLILIIGIIYTIKLKKTGYELHVPLMISWNVMMFFEIFVKVARIGNLLTYTETFASSPWSLPLTMCRIANATTALIFLIYFIMFIWALKFGPTKDPNVLVE